jgi:hypothetical protein
VVPMGTRIGNLGTRSSQYCLLPVVRATWTPGSVSVAYGDPDWQLGHPEQSVVRAYGDPDWQLGHPDQSLLPLGAPGSVSVVGTRIVGHPDQSASSIGTRMSGHPDLWAPGSVSVVGTRIVGHPDQSASSIGTRMSRHPDHSVLLWGTRISQ